MFDENILENMRYAKSWAANLIVRPPFISFRFCENTKKVKNQLFQIAFQPPMTYPQGNYAVHIPLYQDTKAFAEEINKLWPAFRDLAFACKDKLEKNQPQHHEKKTINSEQFKSMSDIAQEFEEEGLGFELERKTRQGPTPTTKTTNNNVQSKITELTDFWHK